MIEVFRMRQILTCAEDTTVALRIRRKARSSEIDLIKKIVAVKHSDCFCKSRMKRAMTRKVTRIVTIVKRKNTL